MTNAMESSVQYMLQFMPGEVAIMITRICPFMFAPYVPGEAMTENAREAGNWKLTLKT